MNWESAKLWGVIALVAVVVASAHMAIIFHWTAKRDAVIWSRLSAVDGRLMSVEAWKAREIRASEADEQAR